MPPAARLRAFALGAGVAVVLYVSAHVARFAYGGVVPAAAPAHHARVVVELVPPPASHELPAPPEEALHADLGPELAAAAASAPPPAPPAADRAAVGEDAAEAARARCHGAPYPLVWGDGGAMSRLAAERREAQVVAVEDNVGAMKKRMKREQQEAAGARRRLLASAAYEQGPLGSRCRGERVPAKKELADDEALVKLCVKDPEGCPDPAGARDAARRVLKGVQALEKRLKCLVVSSECEPDVLKRQAAQAETGKMLSKPIKPAKEDLGRSFASCALVGNGPGVRLPGMGEAIDRHDAVFKFNAYNLGPERPGNMQDNSTAYAGSKQTIRVFNKKRSYLPQVWGMRPAEGEVWVMWHYGSTDYMPKLLTFNPRTYFISPSAISQMLGAYFGLRKDAHVLGIDRGFDCPANLPSGVHAMLMAVHMCEHVNLFGFSFNMQMLEKRPDAASPRVSTSHSWKFDTLMVRMLALAGKVNVCTV